MKDRIASIRKNAGLSQEKFAASLGLTKGAISQWESGIREPSKKVIKLISKEYKINETWLLDGEGEMSSPPSRSDEIAQVATDLYNLDPDSLKYKMIMKLDNFDDDQWELIKQVIDMFSDVQEKKSE